MRGLGQHLDDYVGARIGSPGVGWKNRLANLELLRHETPRLETSPVLVLGLNLSWPKVIEALQGLTAAEMLGHHVAGTFPLFLTHVNSFAKSDLPLHSRSRDKSLSSLYSDLMSCDIASFPKAACLARR